MSQDFMMGFLLGIGLPILIELTDMLFIDRHEDDEDNWF